MLVFIFIFIKIYILYIFLYLNISPWISYLCLHILLLYFFVIVSHKSVSSFFLINTVLYNLFIVLEILEAWPTLPNYCGNVMFLAKQKEDSLLRRPCLVHYYINKCCTLERTSGWCTLPSCENILSSWYWTPTVALSNNLFIFSLRQRMG